MREEPPWWVRDVLILLLIGFILLAVKFWVDRRADSRQHKFEAIQANHSEELENLRFVRQASYISKCNFDANIYLCDDATKYLDGLDLRNQNLRGLQLVNADLNYADLRGTDPDDAVLVNADMSHARLDGASPFGTGFRNAKFSQATFHGTDLTAIYAANADFSGIGDGPADLRGAKLTDGSGRGACSSEQAFWP